MPSYTCRIDGMSPRFPTYADTAASAAELILRAVNRQAKHGAVVEVEITPTALDEETVKFRVTADLSWRAYKI